MCEGSIAAGFLIVTSFFWTHQEQSIRVGWWFLMNGTGPYLLSDTISCPTTLKVSSAFYVLSANHCRFVSFGVSHIPKNALEPWQWYMLITGILTLIIAVEFW